MDTEAQDIETIIADIQHRWGSHALYRASDSPAIQPPQTIPSGFSHLDAAIDGIPRGKITEICGAPTSGMSTFLCKAIIQAQQDGDNILYMDLESAFDADYAAQCGLNIDRLVLARTDSLSRSLEIVRDLLVSCQIGIVVIDFTLDGKQKLPDHALLHRVNARLARSHCALIFLTSVARSEQAHAVRISEDTALRLVFERQEWLRDGQDILGCRSTVTIAKHKLFPGSATITMDIPFDNAVQEDER